MIYTNQLLITGEVNRHDKYVKRLRKDLIWLTRFSPPPGDGEKGQVGQTILKLTHCSCLERSRIGVHYMRALLVILSELYIAQVKDSCQAGKYLVLKL